MFRRQRPGAAPAAWRQFVSAGLVWAMLGGTVGGIGTGCDESVPDPAPPPGDLIGTSGPDVSVSPLGAAVYSIPIAVPPGVGGAQPALALVYDSSHGNGPFGVGWSLSGLSAVSACSPTIEQDGYVGPALEVAQTPGTEPAFCLNGQRLVPMNGSYPGANGTEHRLRMDPGTRAFSHGGGGSRWWRVEYADGSSATFGTTANSRIYSVKALVDRFEDVNGNYLTVTYDQIAGTIDAVPARIDYSGNAAMGVSPYNRVELEYTTNRPDGYFTFFAGQTSSRHARIAAIATYADGVPSLRYQLEYTTSAATDRSLLASVSTCAGGQCLPATQFTYDDPTSPPVPAGWNSINLWTSPATSGAWTRIGPAKTRTQSLDVIAAAQVVLGALRFDVLSTMSASLRLMKDVTRQVDRGSRGTADWNGDGCGDLFFQFWGNNSGVHPVHNASEEEDAKYLYTRVALSAHCLPGGQGADPYGQVNQNYDVQDVGGRLYAPPWEWVVWQVSKEHFQYITHYGDVDGDARADVVTFRRSVEHPENGWRYFVQYANGADSSPVDESLPGHWDDQPLLEANGYADPNEYSVLLPGDFNGDGRMDVLVYTKIPNGLSEQARLFEASGQPAQPFLLVSESTLATAYGAVWQSPPNISCNHWLNNCNPLPIPRVPMVGDVNGDGRADLIVRRQVGVTGNDHLDVHLSKPHPSFPFHSEITGFATSSAALQSRDDGRNQRLLVMDFDSNGMVDVIELVGSGAAEVANVYQSKGGTLVQQGVAVPVGGWGAQSVDQAAYRYVVGQFGKARPGFAKIWRDASNNWVAEHWVANPRTHGFDRESNRVVVGAYVQPNQADMFIPTDWDGNGIDDLVYMTGYPGSYDPTAFFQISGTEDILVAVLDADRQPSDLLTGVRDGLGFGQTIGYRDQKDVRVSIARPRTATPQLAYPSVPYRGPLQVVHTIASDDSELRLFRYTGAVSDRSTGALSFREIWSMDKDRLLVTSTAYEQGFPFTGRVGSIAMRPLGLSATDVQTLPDLGQLQWAWSISKIDHSHSIALVANVNDPPRTVYSLRNDLTIAVEQDPDKVAQLQFGSELGRVQTLRTFDGFGYPLTTGTQVTDANGLQWSRSRSTTYQHDTNDWVLGAIDHMSVSVSEAGDSITREVALTNDASTGQVLSATSDPGTSVEMTRLVGYDGFGNVTSTTIAAPGVTPITATASYDPTGRMPVVVDRGLGHVSYMDQFDGRFGAPTRVRGANNLVTTLVYDAFGTPVERVLPNGRKIWLRNRLVSDPGVPDAVYRTESVRNGAPTAMTYHDRRGREVRSAVQAYDGRWSVTDTEYLPWIDRVAAVSEPRFSNDPAVHWTAFEYDSFQRLSRVTSPTGGAPRISTLLRDGLETTATSPNGARTRVRKDGLARVREVENELGDTTQFSYTAAGQLREVRDPLGNLTTYAYDLRQRLIEQSEPDSGVTRLSWDRLGRLSSVLNANGERENYSYDALGRILAAEGREGLRTWTYDQQMIGLLDEKCGPVPPVYVLGEPTYVPCGSSNAHYRKSFAYDGLARVKAVTERILGTKFVTDLGYDGYGRRSAMVHPQAMGGLRLDVRFKYTATGHLEDAHPVLPLASLPGGVFYRIDERDARGRPTRATLPGGAVASWSFDAATGELLQRMLGTSGNLGAHARSDYAYDVAGNVVSETDLSSNAIVHRDYAYDALSRLVGSTTSRWPGGPVGSGSETLAYDALSNIVRKGDLLYAYSGAGPHQVTRTTRSVPVNGVVGDRFEYDVAGNVTARVAQVDTGNAVVDGERTELTWAPFGKVQHAVRGAESIAIELGADRQQIVRTEIGPIGSDSPFHRVVSVGGHFRHTDGTNKLGMPEQSDIHYVAGAPLPVVLTNGSSGQRVEILAQDGRGSTKAVLSAQGTISGEMDFDVWGSPTTVNGSASPWLNPLKSDTELGFSGHDMWDTMRLIDMGGRVYDPAVGRFMSADPLHSDGLNRYGYARNNPATRIDPTGYASVAGPGGELEIVKHADTRNFTGAYAIHSGPDLLGAAATVAGAADLAGEVFKMGEDTRPQQASVQGGGGPQFTPQEVEQFESFAEDVRWYVSRPLELFVDPSDEAAQIRKLLNLADSETQWKYFMEDWAGEPSGIPVYTPNEMPANRTYFSSDDVDGIPGSGWVNLLFGPNGLPSTVSTSSSAGASVVFWFLEGEANKADAARDANDHVSYYNSQRSALLLERKIQRAGIDRTGFAQYSPRRPWLVWYEGDPYHVYAERGERPDMIGVVRSDGPIEDPSFDWAGFLMRFHAWMETQAEGVPVAWPDAMPLPKGNVEQFRFDPDPDYRMEVDEYGWPVERSSFGTDTHVIDRYYRPGKY